MTTKVTITCQTDSHWDLRVVTQDKGPDGFWYENPYIAPIVLGPGESTEQLHMYVHDSRRYIVEEKIRE